MILACHRWAKFAKEPVILVWTLLRACCFAVFSHLRRWSPGPRINWVVNQLGLSELGHHFLLWWQILHRFSPLFSWQVVDTARCVKPVTFMSNMLYACSILYKTKPLSPHAPDGCRMGEDCEIQKGKKVDAFDSIAKLLNIHSRSMYGIFTYIYQHLPQKSPKCR